MSITAKIRSILLGIAMLTAVGVGVASADDDHSNTPDGWCWKPTVSFEKVDGTYKPVISCSEPPSHVDQGDDDTTSVTQDAPISVVSVTPIRDGGAYIDGYRVVLRNNRPDAIRTASVHVEGFNNVSSVGTCSRRYKYVCDYMQYASTGIFSVDNEIHSGKTLSLEYRDVRGWSQNENVALIKLNSVLVEYRSGEPSRYHCEANVSEPSFLYDVCHFEESEE